MGPFLPMSTVDGPAVLVDLPAPLPQLLQFLLAHTAGTGPLPAPAPLAHAGADADLFAALEAEMAADRLEQAQSERRGEAAASAAFLLAQAGQHGLQVLVPVPDAEAFFETLNRAYVAQRAAELSLSGLPVQVGLEQSAAALLGLDELDGPDEGPGDGSDGSVTLVTLLLAELVGLLGTVLLQLPAAD